MPLICAGLWIAQDDFSLLEHETYLTQLAAAGARFIQIEIDSLIAPDLRIDARGRKQIAELVSRFPVLTTDEFTTSLPTSLSHAAGVYLDVGESRGRPMTFPLSAAARLVRARPRHL